MTDLSDLPDPPPILPLLSSVARMYLSAYVHGMGLGLTVPDGRGVHPAVLGMLSGLPKVAYVRSGLSELIEIGFLAGRIEPRDTPCIWITPDGIRRAVDEGMVNERFAWTLWPHDDPEYADVLAEMGDRGDAAEWRAEIIEMNAECTVEQAEEAWRRFCGRP